MAKFDNLKDAEDYYNKTYMAESAKQRIAAWKDANPSASPAKKEEKKVEKKADEE
tara:strand:+ start:3671 stop:3835 length:165 start_codon:yes stop_codon:yes gene_type:complete